MAMSTPKIVRPVIRRLLNPACTHHHHPPSFLLPPFLAPIQQTSSFSSTTSSLFPRDNNRERGVSTARRTGPRQPLSVSKTALPKPVLDASKRAKVEVDADHGLWDFFHSKTKPMNTPEEDYEHGRPWCVEELRAKSWEDLHSLWWVCCKERNRIATETFERKRLEAGYGDHEAERRDTTVGRTQRAIKQVLTERYYSWRDAEVIAGTDPEVNLSGDGPAFLPSDFDEDLPEENFEAQQEEGLEGAVEEPVKSTEVPLQAIPESTPEPSVRPKA